MSPHHSLALLVLVLLSLLSPVLCDSPQTAAQSDMDITSDTLSALEYLGFHAEQGPDGDLAFVKGRSDPHSPPVKVPNALGLPDEDVKRNGGPPTGVEPTEMGATTHSTATGTTTPSAAGPEPTTPPSVGGGGGNEAHVPSTAATMSATVSKSTLTPSATSTTSRPPPSSDACRSHPALLAIVVAGLVLGGFLAVF